MTKQETIAKAYGEHWETVKDYVDENGWFDFSDDKKRIRYFFHNGENIELNKYLTHWRPKSLAGIETNNGWIKIESEADLPSHGGEYDVVINDRLEQAVYLKSNRWLVNGNYFPKTTQTHGITHYKPIVKPQPPIY